MKSVEYFLFFVILTMIMLKLKKMPITKNIDFSLLFVILFVMIRTSDLTRYKKEFSVHGNSAGLNLNAFEGLNSIVEALYNDGDVVIPGNLRVKGDLICEGNSTVTGNSTISGNLCRIWLLIFVQIHIYFIRFLINELTE